ncbi:MAG: MOSC domain-containing protein [Chloroflexota bacterium]|nr:MOSC domain-containing protein [Chloroflexota bacterium]
MDSTIYSLAYQPKRSKQEEPYHYTRVPVESVTLIADFGIEGDKKARRGSNRQLNIMSYDTVMTLSDEGYHAEPGELGEQIIVRGLDIMALPAGSRIYLGADAVIEIGKPRTGCDWFQQIQDKPKDNTIGRLGVMARVLVGGVVKVGDSVAVVETEPAL